MAQSSSVQTDILVNKITTLIQAGRSAEALPYFDQLESTGTKLPESFYYFQIEALDKAGRKDDTLRRGEQFLNQYGRGSKYYNQVLDIVSRRSIERDQAQQEAERQAACDRGGRAELEKTSQVRVFKQPCTGLLWASNDPVDGVNMSGAEAHCSSLGAGWRLPTVDELRTLHSSGASSCGGLLCKSARLLALSSRIYWASDRYMHEGDVRGMAVKLEDGSPWRGRASTLYGALCVQRL